MNKNVWLIGASQMALEYVKVLQSLEVPFQVIGRGDISASLFEEKTGIKVFRGGLESFLDKNPLQPSHVIVAVDIEQLSKTTELLLNYNVKKILLEKPGALSLNEIIFNSKLAKLKEAKVYIAYNRRFYSPVIKALEIIEQDGGIVSFHFEFTEWIDQITPLPFGEDVKKHWVLGNSSHVIDLAFFLGGFPKEITSFVSGSVSWHPASAVFSGAGISDKGSLFSYHANWLAPGRWGLEVLTQKHRLIFRPMEALKIQNLNSVKIEDADIDNKLDLNYKPGLFLQTKLFLENVTDHLKTLQEQEESFVIYCKMAGYKE